VITDRVIFGLNGTGSHDFPFASWKGPLLSFPFQLPLFGWFHMLALFNKGGKRGSLDLE
jgi:hypothetical protein